MAAKKKRVARNKSNSKNKVSSGQKKIFSSFKLGIVIKNFMFFLLLSVLSFILYRIISEASAFSVLFGVLWVIFFVITLAFFLALLALLILKWMKK